MLKAVLDTHLNDVHLEMNLSAEPGKTTVLLGESGAGKSTVLRLLAGLLHPQQGHISLDETTYFDSERHICIPPQERPFGYVFQDYALFPHLNVFENVAFGLRAQHLPRQAIRQRVGEALEQVRLAGYDQRRSTQLSGGQQQRVAIARALALQPQLLLLDEPLAALYVQTRHQVRQELRRTLANIGITTLFVTHQYLQALLFGHSILVLDAGRVIQQGSQRDLLEHPRSSYVAELVGVNFFRGRVVNCEANSLCTIQLNNGEQPIEVMAAWEEHIQFTRLPVIGVLLVNRLAFPLTRFRNRLLKGFCQLVKISHIVAIDRPCLRFFLGCSRFTIDRNADAFPVRKKFLFDTGYLLPTQLDHFPVTVAFDQRLWL